MSPERSVTYVSERTQFFAHYWNLNEELAFPERYSCLIFFQSASKTSSRTSARLALSTSIMERNPFSTSVAKKLLYLSPPSFSHELLGTPISTSIQSFFRFAFCAPRIPHSSV